MRSHGTTGPPTLLHILGPGLLFAGAAIGVSHIIQSTRAGALYGLALIPAMIVVHVLKYPGISAGARFAGATGRTLVEGYRAAGPVSLVGAGLVFFATALPIQAAIASVTGAVTVGMLEVMMPGVSTRLAWMPAWAWALLVQVLAAALVVGGGFRWLDRVMKALVTLLAVTTVVAAATLLPRVDVTTLNPFEPAVLSGAGLTFLLAFLGWMPAPLDVAIWNSFWSVEKHRDLTAQPPPRLVCVEFLIGYTKCAVLSAAFIVVGAGLLNRGGGEVKDGVALVSQLIDAYGSALSPSLRPMIGVCAFAVMFSTLLSATDALPRIAAAFVHSSPAGSASPRRLAFTVALLVAMATLVLAVAGRRAFLAVIDFATVVSFLSTPVLAIIHHRLMHGPQMPGPARPRRWETALSVAAIGAFTLFAAVYLVDFTRNSLRG